VIVTRPGSLGVPSTDRRPRPLTIADAMIRRPKCSDRATTVGQLRQLFADDHVHATLIVHEARLIAVVHRDDLSAKSGESADRAPAYPLGRLSGRIVRADEDLEVVRHRMIASGRRRLAVVDEAGTLLGLLCLKRSGTGFCTDEDVENRATERAAESGTGC
jgi:CBS-domain-containing membrane protein